MTLADLLDAGLQLPRDVCTIGEVNRSLLIELGGARALFSTYG